MLALPFAARRHRPRGSPRLALLAVLALLPARICAQGASPQAPASLSDLKLLPVIEPHSIDATVSACSDFFQYANGAWLAHDTIPAAHSSSGVTRDMSNRNELVVRAVLDDAVARRLTLPLDSTPRKLGTFYASCMDSAAVEAAGPAPIRPWLAEVDSIVTRDRLVPEIAALQMRGVNVAFRYTPEVDPHDAAHYLAWISQGGLGLPDRDYYTNVGASADSNRRQYVEHVAKLLRLAGQDSAAAVLDAGQVMVLETSLAQASLTRVQRRDPAATVHPMSAAQLDTIAPRVSWAGYFRSIGLALPVGRLNVAEPAFVRRVDSLVAAVPLPQWRAYLRYHVLATAAPWLSTPFVQEDFIFRSRFSGAKQLLPRWKRCLREMDGQLGEALGEAYVAKTFPPEARARAA